MDFNIQLWDICDFFSTCGYAVAMPYFYLKETHGYLKIHCLHSHMETIVVLFQTQIELKIGNHTQLQECSDQQWGKATGKSWHTGENFEKYSENNEKPVENKGNHLQKNEKTKTMKQ